MSSFGFVILHYKTFTETCETIKSIISLPRAGRDVAIVVVDNASENGSTEKLIELFKAYKEITFIKNKENLGFSKGNNVGFINLKKRGYDYIILSNNDIKVISQDFYDKIERDYRKYQFAVLGPGIKNPNDGRTGCRVIPPTIGFVRGRIFRLRIKYYARHLYKIYDRKKRNKQTNILDNKFDENLFCKWKNVTIHGCFFVLSEKYINQFDGLNTSTFMYAEEELLFIRLMSNNMISIYDPEIEVFHEEGAATTYEGKILSKEAYRRHIKAQKVLLKELKKYPETQKIRGEKCE